MSLISAREDTISIILWKTEIMVIHRASRINYYIQVYNRTVKHVHKGPEYFTGWIIENLDPEVEIKVKI